VVVEEASKLYPWAMSPRVVVYRYDMSNLLEFVHRKRKNLYTNPWRLITMQKMDILYIIEMMRGSIFAMLFVNIWALGISVSAGMIARFLWDLLYPAKLPNNGRKQ